MNLKHPEKLGSTHSDQQHKFQLEVRHWCCAVGDDAEAILIFPLVAWTMGQNVSSTNLQKCNLES